MANGNNAKIGGILSIVAGGIGVISSIGIIILVVFLNFALTQTGTFYADPVPTDIFAILTGIYALMGVFYFLLGALAVVGGIFSLRKKVWGLALAGAIAGGITFFPCGIPAIIFVTMAKPEFSDKKPARRRRK